MAASLLLLLPSLVAIVAASEPFTNALEHPGDRLCISNGVTGSVFAAVGTAQPFPTSRERAGVRVTYFGPSICCALVSKACAMRMLARSIRRPSSDTAPLPRWAASAMAATMRCALSTSAGVGV